MKKNIFIIAIMAVIASFIFSINANAQSPDDCLMAQYLKISAKVGNGPFTEVMKNGKATYYRRTGWYIGFNGGINALKVNDKNSINPTGAISVGHEFRHWHADFRGGATQFEYLGSKKIGLVTDLGVYYDFLPAKGRNWNIYAGVFAGYQHIKFKYVIEDWNHKQRSRPNRMSDAEIMLILVKKPTIDVCFVKDGQLDIFGFILNSR